MDECRWELCPGMDDLVEVGPSWVSRWYGLKQRWRERERERLASKQSPSSMRTQQHHLPIRVCHCHCHCIFFIDIVSGWSTITSEGGIGDWRLEIGMRVAKWHRRRRRRFGGSFDRRGAGGKWHPRHRRQFGWDGLRQFGATMGLAQREAATVPRAPSPLVLISRQPSTTASTGLFALSRHVISFSCYCQRWKIEFPFWWWMMLMVSFFFAFEIHKYEVAVSGECVLAYFWKWEGFCIRALKLEFASHWFMLNMCY